MKKPVYTPVIQQYLDIKKDYQDAIVFFRLGDFYEMFFDDAIIASKVLEITLTSKDAEKKIPMAGIPHHAAQMYLQKLIENGFRIAIAEQITPPGKGLVKREVVKYITPGMILEDGLIDKNNNNFIANIILKEFGYILTYFDISTGEGYQQTSLSFNDLINEVNKLKIKEVVLEHDRDQKLTKWLNSNDIYYQVSKTLDKNINQRLTNKIENLDAKKAAMHLIDFLDTMQKQPLKHYQPITTISVDEYMNLTYTIDQQLELTSSQTSIKNTLFYHLNQTRTAVGTRLLQNYMKNPLKDKSQIIKRQQLIESLYNFTDLINLGDLLSEIYDLPRIMGRVAYQNGNARDLVQLKNTLSVIPAIKSLLLNSNDQVLTGLANQINPHEDLFKTLNSALVENPPITIKDGQMIKKGYHSKLDEYLGINEDINGWFKTFEDEMRQTTKIKNLKIGYNRVFGYYIEISKGNVALVKDEFGFERIQTLVNAERYSSVKLKEKESLILEAETKQLELEYEIFVELRNLTFDNLTSIQTLSNIIAEIDVYYSFAKVALENNYVKPVFNNKNILEIKDGRHPVVEKYSNYINNDANLLKQQITLITGPNMSGKSTYMRMIAIIAYMAQIGSYVPSSSANLPIYDGIYTRIGAYDDLAGGRSTFMVEMVETNEALLGATKDSLIIFDEIGRGTATYDGIALAHAIINYIHEEIKAHTLFSTHYHELTPLDKKLDNLVNIHVKASLSNNEMIFYHQIEDGPSDRSYGIQVAQLAGLPPVLIKNADKFLTSLENNNKSNEIDIFNYDTYIDEEINSIPLEQKEVLDDITSSDTNNMTPLDALIKLKYYQNKIKKNNKDDV